MATRAAPAGEALALGLGPESAGLPMAQRLPLPWLAQPLEQARALDRSHGLLLAGPAGAGHLELAGLLAQAWLCEQPAQAPCGRCASCHLVRQRSHPDLLVLVPEAWRVRLGWLGEDEARPDAKPSRELKVEQVRLAIDWSHKTSGRGRGKALLLHPADAMNAASANALLKTLEEPPAGLRLFLTCTDLEALLPTIRSRCQRLALALPDAASARDWLRRQGMTSPEALLALAGGSPLEALAWAEEGVDADWLAELPRQLAAGQAVALQGRALPRVLELLLKLCHDLQLRSAGVPPRFYPADARWPAPADAAALVAWQRTLLRTARHDEHPWNAALLIESLVTQATALWPRSAGGPVPRPPASVHSAR